MDNFNLCMYTDIVFGKDAEKQVANKLGIKIIWGGDWKKPYDPPHFQLAK